MKRILCIFLALITLLIAASGCTPPSGAPEDGEESEERKEENENEEKRECEMLDRGKSYSILFIGNSYTYYNDMPSALFAPMAEAEGYDVSVDAITKGAHTLAKFADPTDEYGARVEAALTGEVKYDFVILQEQSVRPAGEGHEAFYAAVRNLAARIRATGAEPVLYATWGRKTGSSTLATYGWTNESMTYLLAAGYEAIGKELSIPVIHVGLAFRDVYTNVGEIELYNPDLSHPSYAGSYLAAAALFGGIFGVKPSETAYKGGLTAQAAQILLAAAERAVYDTPAIPEEYLTKTEQ